MRSSLHKRLDAVEESFGEGIHVVVYKGLPPYYVDEHKPENYDKVTEPILFDTPEELEAYINSLPKSAQVIEIVLEGEGPDFPSSEIYSWGQ
jgi:hypothetical protein